MKSLIALGLVSFLTAACAVDNNPSNLQTEDECGTNQCGVDPGTPIDLGGDNGTDAGVPEMGPSYDFSCFSIDDDKVPGANQFCINKEQSLVYFRTMVDTAPFDVLFYNFNVYKIASCAEEGMNYINRRALIGLYSFSIATESGPIENELENMWVYFNDENKLDMASFIDEELTHGFATGTAADDQTLFSFSDDDKVKIEDRYFAEPFSAECRLIAGDQNSKLLDRISN